MNMPVSTESTLGREPYGGPAAAAQSAVSWGAILAGAVAAASVSLILIAVGSGLDLLSVSPWSGGGASATTFTVMTAIWFIIIQWVSAGVGGYLAGRLRTRWTGTHTHEVFFRDTAHGFVTWAVGSLLVASILASATASLVSGGTHAASVMGAGAALAHRGPGAGAGGPMAGSYDLDLLFRGTGTEAGPEGPRSDPRAEVQGIVANGLANGDVSAADRSYLASMVSARTGIAQAEAQQRVDTFIAHSKEVADKARKAAAAFALFTAISMLVGAFIACVTAALGGQRRDLHP